MFQRLRYWHWRSRAVADQARRRARLACVLLAILAFADLCYVAGMWPDWDLYRQGPVFKSSFMKRYERDRVRDGGPALRWSPVPLERVSEQLLRTVLVGEDSRFYRHKGFDRVAFEEAMQANLQRRRIAYGGSTISQQTVKNLFLSPSRNPLRKWHELLLTLGMERELEKRRILELYLNVAEFGPGIYGVEAAALHYFGVPAAVLSRRQSAELVASLPAPRTHNPDTRTEFFRARTAKLLRQLRDLES